MVPLTVKEREPVLFCCAPKDELTFHDAKDKVNRLKRVRSANGKIASSKVPRKQCHETLTERDTSKQLTKDRKWITTNMTACIRNATPSTHVGMVLAKSPRHSTWSLQG